MPRRHRRHRRHHAPQIDESHTVGEIVKTLCSKLGIEDADAYALYLETAGKQQAEVTWLQPGGTLLEQGVTEDSAIGFNRAPATEIPLDPNDTDMVDSLYAQGRDAVLSARQPCTLDEALELAALLVQIDHGDYNPERHKPGFLDDLRTVLPLEHARAKNAEKQMYALHRKLVGTAQIDAKIRFIRRARAIKTYGIAFFAVKEKVPGKNKLAGRLLGISREVVVRADEATKEFLKTWPLTAVRRWAATATTFIVDFGGFEDSYLSVQTTQGQELSKLMADNVDAVLNQKKQSDRRPVNARSVWLLLPLHLAPPVSQPCLQAKHPGAAEPASPKAPRASSLPPPTGTPERKSLSLSKGASLRPDSFVGDTARMSMTAAALGLEDPADAAASAQESLSQAITYALDSLAAAKTDLATSVPLPRLGTDKAALEWRSRTHDAALQHCQALATSLLAAAASSIILTSVIPGRPVETDFMAVEAAVATIASNMTSLAAEARVLAALLDGDHGADLLAAGRRVCEEVLALVQAVAPCAMGSTNRQELLARAGAISATCVELLALLQLEPVPPELQEHFNQGAKSIGSIAASLIAHAKSVAAVTADTSIQNIVITSAKGAALAASQLVACTKVLVPTLHSPLCRDQLLDAARIMAASISDLVTACQGAATAEAVIKALSDDARKASRELSALVRDLETELHSGSAEADSDTILQASDGVQGSIGNPAEMLRQTKTLVVASTKLLDELKAEGAAPTDKARLRVLVQNIQALTAAINGSVEQAKAVARQPSDQASQMALVASMPALRAAVLAASSGAAQRKLVERTSAAVKHTCSTVMQLSAAAQAASSRMSDAVTQKQFMLQCKQANEAVTLLIAAVKHCSANIQSSAAQLELLNTAKAAMPVFAKLSATARQAFEHIANPAACMQVTAATKATERAVAELKSLLARSADIMGSLELDGASETAAQLLTEAADMALAIDAGAFFALPGSSSIDATQTVAAASRTVHATLAQLMTAASQANEAYCILAAGELSSSLRTITAGIRSIASDIVESQSQTVLVNSLRDLLAKSGKLLTELKSAARLADAQKQKRVAAYAGDIANDVFALVAQLPGQRDVDSAIQRIVSVRKSLAPSSAGPAGPAASNEERLALQADSALFLTTCGSVVVAAQTAPVTFKKALLEMVQQYSNLSGRLIRLALGIDSSFHKPLSAAMDHLTTCATTLLLSCSPAPAAASDLRFAGKSLIINTASSGARMQSTTALRDLTLAANDLLVKCSAISPELIDTDKSIRSIQAQLVLLEDPTSAVNDLDYMESFDVIVGEAKVRDWLVGFFGHRPRRTWGPRSPA